MRSRARFWIAAAVVVVLASALWWVWSRPVVIFVYFTRAESTANTLADVPRTVRGRGPAALAAAALAALLAGPTEAEQAAGLVSAIPAGTRLRNVQVRDGVVIADFTAELESGGGSASMLGRFWQIVYTATQFPQAPRVRILIDGQERTAMGGEGVIIDHPISRPPTPPRF